MLANGLNTFKLDDAAHDNHINSHILLVMIVPGMKHLAASFDFLPQNNNNDHHY